MAVMAWLHMATNMADIGVYAKNRENIDQQWIEKLALVQKLWPKQNWLWNYGPFSLYFGPKLATKKGSTSHGSSELNFMFLESVDQEEWE